MLETLPQPISYIIACPMYVTIQRQIHSQKTWLKVDYGIEICDSQYQSPSWDTPRRLVMVRQKIKDRPKAGGKILSLFTADEITSGHRHTCYVSNLTLPPVEIWRL